MSPLSRALGVITAAGLIGTSLLASPALAADQNLSVSPVYGSNSGGATTFTLSSTSSTAFLPNGKITLSYHTDSSVTLTNNSGTQPATVDPLSGDVSVDVTLTAGQPGLYDVSYQNPGASNSGTVYSCASCFTVTGLTPTATNFGRTANSGSNPATFTLSGTNLSVGGVVTFVQGGVTDPKITFDNTTVTTSSIKGSLTIDPAAAGGVYDVKVTNADGKTATCAGCLDVPKITGVRRSDQVAGTLAELGYGVSNKTLVVSGVGLSASTSFGFSSGAGNTNQVTVNSRVYDAVAKTVTLDVTIKNPTSQPVDSYNLLALDHGDGYYKKNGVLQLNPRPVEDSNDPFHFDNPGVSSTNFMLPIKGTGFQNGMVAAFNPATGITVNHVTVSSPTAAVLDLTIAASAPLTARTMSLVNPDFGFNATTPSSLTPSAAPVISGSSPASVGAGTTSVPVTLTGSGFQAQSLGIDGTSSTSNSYVTPTLFVIGHPEITMSGSATTNSGHTTLSATLTLPNNLAPGPYRLAYTDKNGSTVECFTASGGACLTIDNLSVTSVAPSLLTNDSVQAVTVNGVGFTAGAVPVLQRSGQPDIVGTNIRNITSTSVTADFDMTGAAPGNNAWAARVTLPNGYTGVKNGAISVSGGAPHITSITPTAMGAGNQGIVLTVNGSNLARGATLAISSIAGATVPGEVEPTVVSTQWVSLSQIKFTLSTVGASTGPRSIVLKNTDQATTPASECQTGACLTINAAPTATSASPASRAAGSATTNVVINGSNFTGTPTVTFSGTGITLGTPTVNPAGTTVTVAVTVAAGAAQTQRTITVTNADKGQAVCTNCFTVIGNPTVESLSPNIQKVGSGPTTVTITGTGFNAGGASVAFSGAGVTAGTATVVNATTITVPVTVAAGAALGQRDVTVTNTPAADGGNATLAQALTVADLPTAPRNLVAAGGNQLVNLTWDAPTSDGGTDITGYTVTVTKTADGSTPVPAPTVTVTGTSAQVTGLVNGTPYSFVVKATNAVGTGPGSAAVSATPATVPDVPTGVTATAGDAQVSLTWTAPASSGGSPVTGYKVYLKDGTLKGSPSGTSFTVTGLTNGTAYQFYVVAVNAVGPSGASDTTAPVTPKSTVPGAPTGLTVSVTAAAGQADLSWTAPTLATLTPVSSYNVSVSPASGSNVGTTTYPVDRTATTATVTGLTNGIVYTFTVKAVNAGGTGPASSPASGTPYDKPGAVQSLSGSAGNQTASASWAAPASNGGSAITGYKATLTPGNVVKTVTSTNVTFDNLTNGVEYTISVVAVNARGEGPSSSVAKTPTPANASLTLTTTAAKVLRGQHIALKGVVTRPDTSVAIGTVTIKVINDQGQITTVTTVTPGADGSYAYDFAPVYNGTYRAYYNGDARNGASQSGTVRTLVAVRISATTATGPATQNALIKGSVLPNKAGRTVTLYSVSSTGKLTKLATATVSSGSTYQFVLKLSKGNHLLQVGMADTVGNAHGEVRFIAKRT